MTWVSLKLYNFPIILYFSYSNSIFFMIHVCYSLMTQVACMGRLSCRSVKLRWRGVLLLLVTGFGCASDIHRPNICPAVPLGQFCLWLNPQMGTQRQTEILHQRRPIFDNDKKKTRFQISNYI